MSLYGHRVVFTYHHPLLAAYDFQGSRGLKQKRKLSPGPDASGHKPDPVARTRHTCDPAPPGQGTGPSRSEHRSRNDYRVPFRHCTPLRLSLLSHVVVVLSPRAPRSRSLAASSCPGGRSGTGGSSSSLLRAAAGRCLAGWRALAARRRGPSRQQEEAYAAAARPLRPRFSTTARSSPAEHLGHRKFILGLRTDSPMFN